MSASNKFAVIKRKKKKKGRERSRLDGPSVSNLREILFWLFGVWSFIQYFELFGSRQACTVDTSWKVNTTSKETVHCFAKLFPHLFDPKQPATHSIPLIARIAQCMRIWRMTCNFCPSDMDQLRRIWKALASTKTCREFWSKTLKKNSILWSKSSEQTQDKETNLSSLKILISIEKQRNQQREQPLLTNELWSRVSAQEMTAFCCRRAPDSLEQIAKAVSCLLHFWHRRNTHSNWELPFWC